MKKLLLFLVLFGIHLLINAVDNKEMTGRTTGSNIIYIDVNIDQPNVDDCYETNVPGIEDNDWLRVYPNPGPGEFSLELHQLVIGEYLRIKVYDITGASVYSVGFVASAEKTTYNLRLPGLEKGVYFLQVDNQRYRSIERLIIF